MTAASLDRALGDTERALIDSSALIAYHTPLEVVHPLAKQLLGRIENDQDPLHGYFSVVSAAEILIRPRRAGIGEFTFMHAFLTSFPNLTSLPMNLTVATQAATLRAVTGIPMPDAIVVASGLLAGCEVIVSNDYRWERRLAPLFKEFKWVYLGDHA